MRGRPAVRALTGWVAAHPVLSFFVTCPAPLTCLFTFGFPL